MKPGDEYTWTFVPRGGYGYPISVHVTISRVGRRRVLVVAPLKSGGTTMVWVRRERLKERIRAL
jgi:hypothetical protein